MPADAPGVTTDDQGSPPSEGSASGDRSSTAARPAPTPEGRDQGSGPVPGGNGAAPDGADPSATAGTTEPGARPDRGAATQGERSGQDAAGEASERSTVGNAGVATEWSAPGEWPAPTAGSRLGSAPDTGAEPGDRLSPPAPAGPGDGPTGELTVPAPDAPPGAPAELGAVPVPAGLPPGAEPPPAPVLVRPPSRLRLFRRGRHAPGRADRASRRGLRVNQRLWSISPWSVFKVSALFYLCVALIVVVAGTLLYNAGRSVGTIDQFESFITRMGAYGECVPTAEVPKDAVFETDEKCDEGEVLVGGFTLDDGALFRAAAIGAAILVVAGSIGNVLLTVLLNLLNELTGGVRHTVIREPVPRPARPGPLRRVGGGRRPPAGAGRPAGGSPTRQLQR
jgi:hypothetical protein